MKKMIDRLAELETAQKETDKNVRTANENVLSPEKSYERDPRLMQSYDMDVREDRQNSYLVGSSMGQSVDLRQAQVYNSGGHSRSMSQSNTPKVLGIPPQVSQLALKNQIAGTDYGMSQLMSGDTSPAPGPSSVGQSLRASANNSSPDQNETPYYPVGARASSDDSRYGTDLYKEANGSILFAGGPGSISGSQGSRVGPGENAQESVCHKTCFMFKQ